MKKIVFIAGLHRSGTSILHRIISTSEEVTGFKNTGVPEDEGQLLQTVFEPAATFGGPGKFAFDKRAHLDENSELINTTNQQTLIKEWEKYWDPSRAIRIEKSPPNLIRTRFFQALFPEAYFITIIRHPIAVSFATQKWSRTGIDDLLRHWIAAHEIYQEDRCHLQRELTFSYEEMTSNCSEVLANIQAFLGIQIDYKNQLADKNGKYFDRWQKNNWWQLMKKNQESMVNKYEMTINRFGYSLKDLKKYPATIPERV